MTLLHHIVSFDVRRYRWLIAAWVTVTIVTVTLLAWSPFFQSGRGQIEQIDLAITFGWLSQLLLAGILLPLVIHAHAATGTTAFWMTRPFPPATLVRAKLVLLIALFLGVPALCDAVMMGIYRVPAASLLLAVAEASLQRAAVLFIFVSLAVLTRNFARFAIAIGGIVVGAAVVINVWILVSMARTQETGAYTLLTLSDVGSISHPFDPDPTPDVLAAVAAIVFGAIVIGYQYRTRATKRSVAIASAGAVVVGFIALAWPWPVLKATTEAPAWALEPTAVQLSSVRNVVQIERGPIFDTPTPWRIGRGQFFVQEVPPGWLAIARLTSAVVTAEKGTRIESLGGGYPSVLASGRDNTSLNAALRTKLDVDAVIGPRLLSTESIVMLASNDPLLDRGFAGHYRGEFAIDLAELSVAAVLPLEAGATMQLGALRITMVDSRWYDAGVSVHYRISDVRSTNFERRLPDDYQFYLRSPSRRQATEGQHNYRGRVWMNLAPLTGNVYLSAASPFYADMREMTFSSNYFGTQAAVNVDGSWKDDAELVIVRTHRAGTIKRTLELPLVQFLPPR